MEEKERDIKEKQEQENNESEAMEEQKEVKQPTAKRIRVAEWKEGWKDRVIQENDSKVTTEKRKRDEEDDDRLVKRALFDNIHIILVTEGCFFTVIIITYAHPDFITTITPSTNIIFNHQPSSPTHSVTSNLSGSSFNSTCSQCISGLTELIDSPTSSDPMLELHLNTLKLVKQAYKTNNLRANINQTLNTLAQHLTPSASSATSQSKSSTTTTHCTYKLTSTGLLSSRTYPHDYDTKSVLDQRCSSLIPHEPDIVSSLQLSDLRMLPSLPALDLPAPLQQSSQDTVNEPSTDIIKEASTNPIPSPIVAPDSPHQIQQHASPATDTRCSSPRRSRSPSHGHHRQPSSHHSDKYARHSSSRSHLSYARSYRRSSSPSRHRTSSHHHSSRCYRH